MPWYSLPSPVVICVVRYRGEALRDPVLLLPLRQPAEREDQGQRRIEVVARRQRLQGGEGRFHPRRLRRRQALDEPGAIGLGRLPRQDRQDDVIQPLFTPQ